jgi:sodium/potassium-transporting ATPase subunit alpha
LYLGLVLFGVVFITSVFAYYQESKSESMMASFKNMIPEEANVIRDGEMKSIPAQELVIGDLIKLNQGDKVPADIRVVYAKNMKVYHSKLF